MSSKAFLLVFALCILISFSAIAQGQVAQPPDRPAEHQHMHSMEMNIPSGVTDKCAPNFTYTSGPTGPSHWQGICTTGHTQAPIDITSSQKMPVPPLAPLLVSYEPADLDVVNACNQYEVKVRFPDNKWLKVARKPYRLSEIVFHEPGEIAVNGKRPAMSLQFIHLSPELSFLIIEVPVIAGKENSVIRTILEHIPDGGKEEKVADRKINAMDLLPADHGFYFFRGSLTRPGCNEGVMWYLMKNPVEMSQAQIDKFKKYYHDNARPLQPVNDRPVVESK